MESRADTSVPKNDMHLPKSASHFFGVDVATPDTIAPICLGGVRTKLNLGNLLFQYNRMT